MKDKFTVIDVIIYLLLGFLGLSIVLTFIHLFTISLSPSYVATKGGLHLWPTDLTWDNYAKVVKSKYIWYGYGNTLFRNFFQ